MDRQSAYVQSIIDVPRTSVGIVIGKGGEMIKKIQAETGAKVQFQQDDGQSPERVCAITGPPDRVQQAASMINELLQRASFSGRGGRGGSRGGRGGYSSGGSGRGMSRGYDDGNYQDQTTSVPADKCGLVIGKGGESIKQINQQSGAHVELSRQPGPNPNEKIFNIRGSPSQIQHAIELINEKAGVSSMGSADQGWGNQYGGQGYGGSQHAAQGWGGGYGQ
ncbi:hypothetical protein ACJMK2_039223 [Sinanodonta woodiana]|uniref:K Homology domain-containing protein n=1 Tax=Sinanodonta woodiana TaxID=1069815 RepID=A0ABD3WF99_SINWO